MSSTILKPYKILTISSNEPTQISKINIKNEYNKFISLKSTYIQHSTYLSEKDELKPSLNQNEQEKIIKTKKIIFDDYINKLNQASNLITSLEKEIFNLNNEISFLNEKQIEIIENVNFEFFESFKRELSNPLVNNNQKMLNEVFTFFNLNLNNSFYFMKIFRSFEDFRLLLVESMKEIILFKGKMGIVKKKDNLNEDCDEMNFIDDAFNINSNSKFHKENLQNIYSNKEIKENIINSPPYPFNILQSYIINTYHIIEKEEKLRSIEEKIVRHSQISKNNIFVKAFKVNQEIEQSKYNDKTSYYDDVNNNYSRLNIENSIYNSVNYSSEINAENIAETYTIDNCNDIEHIDINSVINNLEIHSGMRNKSMYKNEHKEDLITNTQTATLSTPRYQNTNMIIYNNPHFQNEVKTTNNNVSIYKSPYKEEETINTNCKTSFNKRFISIAEPSNIINSDIYDSVSEEVNGFTTFNKIPIRKINQMTKIRQRQNLPNGIQIDNKEFGNPSECCNSCT